MQLVRIAGPTEAMLRLADVEGLDFERTSANRLDEDTWQVAGYATDEALAELDARGLQTELVVPAEQVAAERRTLFAAITRDEGDAPGDAPAEDDPSPADASAADDPSPTDAPGDDDPSPADAPADDGPSPTDGDPEGGDA
jgi:hypothetical protein